MIGLAINLLFFLFVCIIPPPCAPHGRLMDPPMRASIWRFPEFDKYNPPVNYDDDSYWCGGMVTQHNQNGGKCGVCGDNWSDPVPRDMEHGGKFGRGIIVREYSSGQTIPLSVYLTGAHDGYFEFRLCNMDVEPESQSCYDKHLLPLGDKNGMTTTKLPATRVKGFYNTTARLPSGLTCSHCSIQWHYRTGNNWGRCENNGTYAVGCGDQETFRGCSDVKIN